MSNEAGVLYVVATPIGNAGDLSPRAREVLAGVDAVAAEDTRRAGRLLRSLGLHLPLVSCHEHNEQARVPGLVQRLQSGESLALVSDAGTPLVSDPGYRLVRAVRQAGLRVSPVPGPSAALAALSVAGLPSDRFAFEGFLPARGAARRTALEALADETRTLIFFEAGRRVAEALADLATAFGGQREACLARELTKDFETVRSGTLAELRDWVAADPHQQRGEIVLLVRGAEPPAARGRSVDAQRVLDVLLDSLPTSEAVSLAARITGLPRNRLYRQALGRQS